ncbi:hypothetical protein WJX72_012121 [[Myrmecia] bisecta]|uniref:Uncharacterized protein n=1 Tax=[Myrmecia] bisecta TaxID=41462 RepID=A0AAW1QT65_9CHLO
MPPQATPCSGCGARATDRQDFGWHITCLHIAGASAVRLGLAWLGVGPSLQDRIEIATPLTSLTRLREGLFLMQYGSSPYAGSAYHAAPLLLPLLGSTASHPILYILPGLVADALAALSLAHLQRQLTRGSTRPAVGYSLAALYLWNPLAILACCGGSSAPLENAAGLFALASAVAVNAPFAAFGIVCAAYLSLHPLTLMVGTHRSAALEGT